ncbi:MAG TPA: hypothetical protein VGU44_02360 [Gammaproteobacteria bacterium]|nr:hypothetical protein [Gammaproteobacteria bacterium]
MRKLGKELKRAERNARHGIEKTAVKLQLDSERNWARAALEGAEQGLREVNAAVQTATDSQSTATQSLETARTGALISEDTQKEAGEKLGIINTLVDALLAVQTKIAAEEKTTREERGKVSSIPNEMDNPEDGERQGKEACQKAQASAKVITDMLVDVRSHLANIQAASQVITTLLSTDRKESQEECSTAGEPVEGAEVFNVLDTSHHVDYKVPAEQAAQNVERKGAQEQQNVGQEQPLIPLAQPVHAAPPAYEDGDAPRLQDGAVVVHAQFSAPLSPRSNALLDRLATVQTKLTDAIAQKTEAEAVEDAQFFVGLLADIHALKRTVRGQQPQAAAKSVQRLA